MAQNRNRKWKRNLAWFGGGVVVGALIACPLIAGLARSLPDLEPSNWFDLAAGILSALIGGGFTIGALWFGFRHERRQREAETRAGLAEQISKIMSRLERRSLVRAEDIGASTSEALALGRRLFRTSPDLDSRDGISPFEPDMAYLDALFALDHATYEPLSLSAEDWIRNRLAPALRDLMNEIAGQATTGPGGVSEESRDSLRACVERVAQLAEDWNLGRVQGRGQDSR